jgi:O-antigen ligase
LQNNPIIGVGFNTYRYTQEKKLGNEDSVMVSHAGAGTSNSYLLVLATTGVVGLFIFIYSMAQVLKSIIKSKKSPARTIAISVFTVVSIGSLTENVFFYSSIMILTCCLLGIYGLYTKEKSVQ